MRDWMEDLSDWMEKKEKISFYPSTDFSDAIHQTLKETNSLLQASDQLYSVYSQIIGKADNDNA